MLTLTNEQAEVFRSMRKGTRQLLDDIDALIRPVLCGCEHTDDNDPECPVCAVYQQLADAQNLLHDLPENIDGHLMNGPHPAERGAR